MVQSLHTHALLVSKALAIEVDLCPTGWAQLPLHWIKCRLAVTNGTETCFLLPQRCLFGVSPPARLHWLFTRLWPKVPNLNIKFKDIYSRQERLFQMNWKDWWCSLSLSSSNSSDLCHDPTWLQDSPFPQQTLLHVSVRGQRIERRAKRSVQRWRAFDESNPVQGIRQIKATSITSMPGTAELD